MNKIKLTFVVLIVLATAISCINPLYPNEQMLQHLGTLALLIPLIRDLFKNTPPTCLYRNIVLHVSPHPWRSLHLFLCSLQGMGCFFRYRRCQLLPVSSQPLRPPCPLLLWLLVSTFNVLFGSKVDQRQNSGGTPDGMALDSDGEHDLRTV